MYTTHRNSLKTTILKRGFLFTISCILSLNAVAQNTKKTVMKPNVLYQYGIAESFFGGLFKEGIPVSRLSLKGDFGLVAASLLDGEMIQSQGKVYQTKADGQTIIAPDSLKAPFAMVCFFKPDTSFRISSVMSQKEVFNLIESHLPSKNGIYAIKISGLFKHVKTRSFHPVEKTPYPPIAEVIAGQEVFDYGQARGIMFGFKMPDYTSQINVAGFHFHFLSDKADKGGHVLDFEAESILVEIALIKSVELEIPDNTEFFDCKFKNSGLK